MHAWNDFQLRLRDRHAKKLIRPEFFGKATVANI